MKPYLLTNAASAQIQAVGVSLQIRGTIIGIAPSSWYKPGGRIAKRSVWPSCLAVTILSAHYSAGTRVAFGINIGCARAAYRTRGRHSTNEATGELGWQFWHRTSRAKPA